MTLGQLIKNYREEHGISARTFASMSGLSNTYVSNLEKGFTPRGKVPVPSIDTYRNVARAMGLTVDELVRMVDDLVAVNEVYTKEEKELIVMFRQLNGDNQSRLRDYAAILESSQLSVEGKYEKIRKEAE